MNQSSKHPFENCRFELFKEKSSRNWFSRFLTSIALIPRRIKTTYLLFKCGELREPASKNMCPLRAFNPYVALFFSFQLTTIPNLMKAILRHHRKDPKNGLFNDQETKRVWLAIIRDLFPEEGAQEDDIIMTCLKEHHAKYRQPIMQFIGPNNIKKHTPELERVAAMIFDEYAVENQAIDSTEFTFTYTTSIISHFLLGHPGPISAYRKISMALDCLNRGIVKKSWHQPFSKEEKEGYQRALETMRSAINTSLASSEKPTFGSFKEVLQEKMNPLQTKISLYVMYFAGSETSAALLNYLLWQLGRHPEYQEAIYNEIAQGDLPEAVEASETLNKVFAESMRLFSPTILIPRRAADDLVCQGKDPNGNLVYERKIKRNEILAPSATFAGRDPYRFENPDAFQPGRFQEVPETLDWSPFGGGPHVCPGQWLAKSEILIFTGLLIRRFRFSSLPEREPKQRIYMTTKLAEKTSLFLTRR